MVDLMCEECYYKGDKNEFQLNKSHCKGMCVNMSSALKNVRAPYRFSHNKAEQTKQNVCLTDLIFKK